LSSGIKEIHFQIDSGYNKELEVSTELQIKRKLQKKFKVLNRKDIKISNITVDKIPESYDHLPPSI